MKRTHEQAVADQARHRARMDVKKSRMPVHMLDIYHPVERDGKDYSRRKTITPKQLRWLRDKLRREEETQRDLAKNYLTK